MFKIEFYDNLTKHIVSSWWMYLILGVNFILLAIFILLFPDLLAYLVATFLLANGIVFVILAWATKGIKGKYVEWKGNYKIPVK